VCCVASGCLVRPAGVDVDAADVDVRGSTPSDGGKTDAPSGPFAEPVWLSGSGLYGVADVDGRGPGMIVGGGAQGLIRLDPASHQTQLGVPDPGDTEWVAIGDLDADGDLDFVVGFSTVQLYLNDGTAKFTAGPVLGGGEFEGLVIADMNHDGMADVVVQDPLTNGGGVYAFEQTAIGWPMLGGIATEKTNAALAAADLDGDGFPEVIILQSGGLAILHNDGKGDLTSSTLVPWLGRSEAGPPRIARLDADGAPDLAFAGAVAFNDGKGGFGTPIAVCSGGSTVADMDGDGDLDVVCGSGIYFNDGKGTFTAGPTFTDESPARVEVADLNGDGALDVAESAAQGLYVILATP
jgi:hypothetical protein